MKILIPIIPLVLVGVAIMEPPKKPPNPFSFEEMPHVASVESTNVRNPSHRVIHILNWQYALEEDYFSDLQDLNNGTLTEETISLESGEITPQNVGFGLNDLLLSAIASEEDRGYGRPKDAFKRLSAGK